MLDEKTTKGFTLVEVLIAASIIVVSILAIVGVYGTFVKQTFTNTPAIQAAYLADEGVESLKSMRDFGWASYVAPLTIGNTYHLYYNSALARWQATTSSSTIDSTFDRYFVLGNAYRDASDNLVNSGTLDPNTRLVTVTVSWNARGATSTKTVMTYINNLFNN